MNLYDHVRSLAPKYYVALLRVFMGAFYLRLAVGRVMAVETDPTTFKTRLAAYESAGQFSWFQPCLAWAIDPLRSSYFLPALWVAAPLMLGASLVLGLFTRTSTVLGCLLVTLTWLVRFHSAAPVELMMLELQFAVLLTLCLAAAGRTCGIDGIFWSRRILSTFHDDGPTYAAPRIPVFKEAEPIPLSENKPGTKIVK